MRAILTAMPVLGVGAAVERTFDYALLPEELDRAFRSQEALFSNLTLANGVQYEWGLELRVDAGIIPADERSETHQEDTRRITAEMPVPR